MESGVNITILQSTLQQPMNNIFGKIESIQITQEQLFSKETEAANFDIDDVVQQTGLFLNHTNVHKSSKESGCIYDWKAHWLL